METKTHEQQQIETQSKTIDSLNRTIESLERELQKCLEPGKDAGEYKLERPGSSHVETELHKCLDSDGKKSHHEDDEFHNGILFHRIYAKAQDIIQATFGEIDANPLSEVWLHFRDFLISDDRLDHFRTDQDFKWGMWQVIHTLSILDEIRAEEDEGKFHDLYVSLSEFYTESLSMGETDDHESVLKLVECVNIWKGQQRIAPMYDMDDEDFAALAMDLEVILYSQRLAIKASKQRKPKNS